MVKQNTMIKRCSIMRDAGDAEDGDSADTDGGE